MSHTELRAETYLFAPARTPFDRILLSAIDCVSRLAELADPSDADLLAELYTISRRIMVIARERSADGRIVVAISSWVDGFGALIGYPQES